MKTVMFYDLAPGGMEKAPLNFAAHRARLGEFHARGVLLMAGPLGHPPEGALGIFTSREAAEEFVREDPFVLNGVVQNVRLVAWNEVLA